MVIKWRSKMKTDIELLIEHLRKEKIYLEGEMNRWAFDRNFEEADFFLKPLGIVNEKLRVLQLIEPTSLLKIDQLNDSINNLKKRIEYQSRFEKGERTDQLITKMWKRVEAMQFSILELQEPIEKKTIDSQVVDDALFELLNKEYSILKFHLEDKRSNLELSIVTDSQLLFCLTSTDVNKKPFWDNWTRLGFFKKIGFRRNEETSFLEYKIELKDFGFLDIKKLLAYIFFEGIVSTWKFNDQFFIEKI